LTEKQHQMAMSRASKFVEELVSEMSSLPPEEQMGYLMNVTSAAHGSVMMMVVSASHTPPCQHGADDIKEYSIQFCKLMLKTWREDKNLQNLIHASRSAFDIIERVKQNTAEETWHED
jgi:hypothetical protein